MIRLLALAATALGLLLAAAAALLLITSPPTVVGDVAAVEDSLTPNPPDRAVESESDATTDADTPLREPLWTTNDQSLLTAVARPDAFPVPIGLTIESLNVDADIEPYGTNPRTGQMSVPRNVNDVAWYQHGPKPGQSGSAVLAAHVDLAGQGPGVFFRLKDLSPGDRIKVSYEDGREVAFEVVARTIYQKEDLPIDTIFSRAGDPLLTLVTCGGGFDATTAHYDSNVVVYARPVLDVPLPPAD